ncbi:MAG: hypothetical protein AAB778_03500 [Patescibacteria group bacterium]
MEIITSGIDSLEKNDFQHRLNDLKVNLTGSPKKDKDLISSFLKEVRPKEVSIINIETILGLIEINLKL